MSNQTDDSLLSLLSTSPISPDIKPLDLPSFIINKNNFNEKIDEIFCNDLLFDCCFEKWIITEDTLKELSLYFKKSTNTSKKIKICKKFIDNCNVYGISQLRLNKLLEYLQKKL